MSAEVTIIIVSHYSAADLQRCLPSIPDASRTPTPTIVIDNATLNSSVVTVVKQFDEVKLISGTENLGYGCAVNRAVREGNVSTDWILVTNPDTEFQPHAIDNLVTAAESVPLVGSAGPRIFGSDGSIYPSARAIPSLRNGLGHAVFSRVWPKNPWSEAYLRARISSDSSATDLIHTGWLSGACVLVRREAFENIGGFDPRFFMYFEDVDLGERLGRAGYVNIYVPSAGVTHIGGQSTRRYSQRMLAVHHRSAYLYLAKRYSAWYLWPLRALLRAGLAVRSAFIR
jgi:N-acetylglucosaminyl-diphospho-decaprenol L-rhamnosyltransferase